MTGEPVELCFTSDAGAPRLTLEPDDPGRMFGAGALRDGALRGGVPGGRVALCVARMAGLGPDPGVPLDAIMGVQRGARLRFGAWLGVRAGGRPVAKLYAEIPQGRDPGPVLPEPLGRVGRDLPLRPVMVGFGSGTAELYLTCRDPLVSALPRLLAPAGQGHRAADAAAVLFTLAGRIGGAALPVRDVGVSYKCVAGDIVAVTVYATALALFGGDDRAAGRLADAARSVQGDLTAATRFVRGLPPAGPGQLRHGMVGLTFAGDGGAVLSCGIAAPVAVLA